MEIIKNFEKKGGNILWVEGQGCRASWVGTPKKLLIDLKTHEVYRMTEEEWNNPPEGLTRMKGFYG